MMMYERHRIGHKKRALAIAAVALWAWVAVASPVFAQTPQEETKTQPLRLEPPLQDLSPKPIDYILASPERHWSDYAIPLVTVQLLNVAYWAPARFIAHTDFSQISLKTMRGNIAHGWVFDEDAFSVNQLGHPYQGGGYFNAARAMGLSFWESAPYVLLGSLHWEFLMESGAACCYPSINDFVTTTLGGIVLGEVLWRLSNAVLRDDTSGGERRWRETAAFLVNPPYGIHRLISGRAFRDGAPNLRDNPLWGESSLGLSLFGSGYWRNYSSSHWSQDVAIIPRLRLRQGLVTTIKDNAKPFDYFDLELAVGLSNRSQGVEIVGINFNTVGLLAGKKFQPTASVGLVLGAGLDFDFWHNVLADLGQSAGGAMALMDWQITQNLSLHGRALLMASYGAITTDHPEIRRYNLGLGSAIKAYVRLQHKSWGEFYARLDRHWIPTWSGPDGQETAYLSDIGLSYPLGQRMSLGTRLLIARRIGKYEGLSDSVQNIFLGEGFLLWKI